MQHTISILGCGWLGTPLAQHLLEKEYSIKGSTTSKDKLAALSEMGIESFLLKIGASEGSWSGFLDTDILVINVPSKSIQNFGQLLEKIRSSRVSRIIFVSSTSVYTATEGIVTESDETGGPLWEIEKLFALAPDLQVTILRMGGLIDDRRHPGHFFSGGRSIRSAQQPVNLVHLRDAVGCIDAVITKAAWGKVYNVCAGSHPDKAAYYSRAARAVGNPVPPIERTDVQGKVVSSALIRAELGYEYAIDDLMNWTGLL